MRVSEFRCLGSVLLERDHVQWFVEGRLNRSKVRRGVLWGTCVFCGVRHYDRLPKVGTIK